MVWVILVFNNLHISSYIFMFVCYLHWNNWTVLINDNFFHTVFTPSPAKLQWHLKMEAWEDPSVPPFSLGRMVSRTPNDLAIWPARFKTSKQSYDSIGIQGDQRPPWGPEIHEMPMPFLQDTPWHGSWCWSSRRTSSHIWRTPWETSSHDNLLWHPPFKGCSFTRQQIQWSSKCQ